MIPGNSVTTFFFTIKKRRFSITIDYNLYILFFLNFFSLFLYLLLFSITSYIDASCINYNVIYK
jgi:hypothetical protein